MELTTNPFHYGGPVGSNAFCNRTQELHDLRRAAENGDRLFVYGERRLGKTSLVERVIEKLPSRSFLPVYIDLWPTDGTEAFIRATAKAIGESTSSKADKIAETAKSIFRHLTPTITFDESGHPVLSLGSRSGGEIQPELEDVLDAPARLAEKVKKRVVMVFDEFQRITEYGDDLVERMFRSRTQHHRGICYLLLGSRKHVMQEMFLDASRPLYRAAGHYPIGMIAARHWMPFIRERFEAAGKSVDEVHIGKLIDLTDGHPFYTQHLAHALWEITAPGDVVTEERLAEALDTVLRREEAAYAILWETLSRSQQRLLRGLAAEGRDAQPFSKDFVGRYGLGTSSSVQTAARTLIERDVVDREAGSLSIVDRFFRLWLRRLQ